MSEEIYELRKSSIFKDNSSAVLALVMFRNLKHPHTNPLLDAVTGKKYTIRNFSEYLVDHCKVNPRNTEKAIKLLRKLPD